MLTRLMGVAIVASVLVSGVALAQSQSKSNMPDAKGQQAQTLPQEIKQKLEKQGFTEVQVVPGSYIVSAKAKDGDRVTAIIGPNSMTVFTMNAQDSGSTTGSGSGSQSGRKAPN